MNASAPPASAFNTPAELIEELKAGRMVILMDDEDRENEGDLVIPAQMATPHAINFMATHGRGLICLALPAARIDAQATDEQRRAAADVLLDNNDTPKELSAQVDRLWQERVTPFADNLAAGRRREREPVITLSDPDPTWPAQAARHLARIAHALGDRAATLDHIGSTAVPGLVAKDVLDLQVGVASLADADEEGFVRAMTAAGYPRVDGYLADHPRVDGRSPQEWPKRFHGNSDPCVAVHVHVREVGSPGWRWALLFRAWLRAEATAREEYTALKREVAGRGLAMEDYAEAKEPWFDGIHERLEVWARETGWTPEGR